jgi:hypothetical protein
LKRDQAKQPYQYACISVEKGNDPGNMSRASTHSIVLFNGGADAPLLLEFSHTCDVTPKRYCFHVPCLQLAQQKQITQKQEIVY